MAKAAVSKDDATKDEPITPEDAPQLSPEYKPDANVLTDNRRSDYDQPNLQNPESEKIERNAALDGLDNSYDVVNHGRSDKKEIKKPKPFKNLDEAMKYIGKQVVIARPFQNDFFGEMTGVTKEGVMINGVAYPFSAVAPWEGTTHFTEDIYKGDPAYDIDVKHGYGSETDSEDKKKREKKEEKTAEK